jgi:hypothetical protein
MKKILFVSSLFLSLIYGLSCVKDKPTPVDPCLSKTAFKADFDICELVEDSLYATDTIGNFEMWVRANGDYDAVEFTVGNDARVFKSQKFKLEFNDSEIGQTIVVKMKGFKSRTSGCFPNEKTVDSLTKNFVVVCTRNWSCSNRFPSLEYPFVGKFKGFNTDEPNKEFTVNIVNFGSNPGGATSIAWDIQIYNFPIGCGGTRANNFCGDGVTTNQNMYALDGGSPGYRSFQSSFPPDDGSGIGKCCGDIRMSGYISPSDRNTIIIWHRKYDKTSPRKFIGKRI